MNNSVIIEHGCYLIDTTAWTEQRVGRLDEDLTTSLRTFVNLDVFDEYRSGMDISARMQLWCAARDWVIAEGAPIYHDHGCLTCPVNVVLASGPQPDGGTYALVQQEGDRPAVYQDITSDEGYWNQVRAVDIVCPEGHRWAWLDDTSLLDEHGHETTIAALFGSGRQAPFAPCRDCAQCDDAATDIMCDCGDSAVIYCPACHSRCRLTLSEVPTYPQRTENSTDD
jgi:hypothetical protein